MYLTTYEMLIFIFPSIRPKQCEAAVSVQSFFQQRCQGGSKAHANPT